MPTIEFKMTTWQESCYLKCRKSFQQKLAGGKTEINNVQHNPFPISNYDLPVTLTFPKINQTLPEPRTGVSHEAMEISESCYPKCAVCRLSMAPDSVLIARQIISAREIISPYHF